MAQRRNAGSVSLRLSLEDGETVRQALKNIGQEGDRALKLIENAAPGASQGLGFLDSSARTVSDRLDGLAGSAGGAGRMLAAAGPFGLAAGAAVGIMVSMAAATLNAARQISDMRREAERAGQSFESFQELAVIANRSGVAVDALADGMRELQLRADEFIQTDGGAGKEAFERLGFDRASVNTALQDVDGFFDDVMGRIGELDRAAQIRVLDELFGGTAGEQFTRLLDEGLESITVMREEAHATGQVLSEEVGEEAEELRRKYDEAANILKVQMQEGLTSLMPVMTDLVEAASSFVGFINDAVEGIATASGDLSAETGELAGQAIQELEGRALILERRISTARVLGQQEDAVALRDELDGVEARIQRLQAYQQSIRSIGSTGPQSRGGIRREQAVSELEDPPILSTTNRRTDADRERSRLERLAETYRRDLSGALGVYERSLDEVARLVDANLLTQEEGLRVEIGLRATLNQTLEKERQTRLAAATDPMSGALRALEAIEEQAFDSASLIEDALTGAFSGVEDSMAELATTGKTSFSDLVDSLKADAARLVSRQLITGPASQLLSSALSGVFGFGQSVSAPTNLFPFADGGVMSQDGPLPLNAYSLGGIASSPQMAIYGEGRKSEAYVPLPDGRTIPVTMQGGQSSGGGLVEVAVRVDNDGNLRAFIESTSGNVTARAFEVHNKQRARQDRVR